ncbi:uncharacterized protein isoform X2 [Musca autumnalis]|uniref:uncharacterized protein isoform X2 n=2 Tax=Musca autumnalis TaxID=221902 RepID=UPI003CF2F0E1
MRKAICGTLKAHISGSIDLCKTKFISVYSGPKGYLCENRWTNEQKLLLVDVWLRHKADFDAKKQNKVTIWRRIMQEIRETDSTFPFSRYETASCFTKLMICYRRSRTKRKRRKRSPNSNIFNKLDEVFGSSLQPLIDNSGAQFSGTCAMSGTANENENKDVLGSESGALVTNDIDTDSLQHLIEDCNDSLLVTLRDDDVSSSGTCSAKRPMNQEFSEAEDEELIEDPFYMDKGTMWNMKRKKLVIEARLRHQPDFESKKNYHHIWQQILEEIREIDHDFPFSKGQIIRGFVNIMTTYKRIKKRLKTYPKNTTKWEFFDMLDATFGNSHNNVPADPLNDSDGNVVMVEKGKQWNHERRILLINVRLSHQPDFVAKKKKKSTIWNEIIYEIKKIDESFPFNRNEAQLCFLQLMITYKRIKKRQKSSGKVNTTWEYFDILDKVMGSYYTLDPKYDKYDDVEPENKVWTHVRRKLLLDIRLRHQPDFANDIMVKSTIWKQILHEIKQVDESFPFDTTECSGCFVQLMNTYRRIKNQGDLPTIWPYYDTIEKVFGNDSSNDLNIPKNESRAFVENLKEEKNKKWTHERKKLMLDIRLKYQPDFVAKKIKHLHLWDQITKEIKLVDKEFPFDKNEVESRFKNLVQSYNRIKQRFQGCDVVETNWEFFDTLDKVFGSCNTNNKSDNTLMSKTDTSFCNIQTEEKETKWNYEKKKILAEVRLRRQPDFESNMDRIVLWKQIMAEIKNIDPNFSFSLEEIKITFQNLMVSYKRIKQRHRDTGEKTTNWEFFDDFDKVFGSRSNTPNHLGASYSESLPKEQSNSDDTKMYDNTTTMDHMDDFSSSSCDTYSLNGSKRKRCDFLGFSDEETENDTKQVKLEVNSPVVKEELFEESDSMQSFTDNEAEDLPVERAKLFAESPLRNTFLEIERERLDVEREQLLELKKISGLLERLADKSTTETSGSIQLLKNLFLRNERKRN